MKTVQKNRVCIALVMVLMQPGIYSGGGNVEGIEKVLEEKKNSMTVSNADGVAQEAGLDGNLRWFRELSSDEQFSKCLERQLAIEQGQCVWMRCGVDGLKDKIQDITEKTAQRAHELKNGAEYLGWYAKELKYSDRLWTAQMHADRELQYRFTHYFAQIKSNSELYRKRLAQVASALEQRSRAVEQAARQQLRLVEAA